MSNVLGNLKTESVGKACRDFVNEYVDNKLYEDKSATDFFRQYYRIRSSLLHSGTAAPTTLDELSSLTNELDRLVADLLVASIRVCLTDRRACVSFRS